jgi:NodT family efflux transporter outer membrane factor (OMF) lipoprotein
MKEFLLVLMCFAAGCKVGPSYRRPAAPVPPAFREQPPDGWKQAHPSDAIAKGQWWEIYNDPALNALAEQVSLSNQNVAQAEAQFQQARAVVRQARSALFPTAGGSAGITESRAGSGFVNTGTGATGMRTVYRLPLTASWEPDLWGNLRRGVTANVDVAQSFAAALANARLLFQSELAQDYFQLRGLDAQADLLQRTTASYEELLTLTKKRFKAGVASDLDVSQAESQLYSAQSQLIDLGVHRAALEHAIAVLTGKAPAELKVPPATQSILPPPVPIALPSELLERRPDIANSERLVAAANEQIGIAKAAYYPLLTLSGTFGLQSDNLVKWLSLPSQFWSLGPQLAATLFDAGRRGAIVAEQRAAYDATVAAYRQTVLNAFGQVEDNLAALRILATESGKVQQTVESATRALHVSTAQYKAGTTSYLTVITSQAALLSSQVDAVTLLTRRLNASVLLVQALGGGWNASQLPTRDDLARN